MSRVGTIVGSLILGLLLMGQTALVPGQMYVCPVAAPTQASTPTPTPSPSPIPTIVPTSSPTQVPTATPTPLAQTITLSSPINGQIISVTTAVLDDNNKGKCNGLSWYDDLYVDSVEYVPCDFSGCEFVPSSFSVGPHTLQIFAHTSDNVSPAYICDSSNIVSITVATPSPIPTSIPTATPISTSIATSVPTSTATPIASPAHFSTLPYRATLPTETQCAEWVHARPIVEHVPANTPFNIPPVGGVPVSFYTNPTPSKGDNQSIADFAHVTGNFGGTTDEIVRWVACKNGIDEDIVRAQGENESGWKSSGHGDKQTTQSKCVNGSFSTLWNTSISMPDGTIATCPNCCWQSWSMWQTKVFYEYTTWPMMMKSTSFAGDYRYADERSCLNGNYSTYFASKNQQPNTYSDDIAKFQAGIDTTDRVLWGCTGMHLSGGWWNSGATNYINQVKAILAAHSWPGGLQ